MEPDTDCPVDRAPRRIVGVLLAAGRGSRYDSSGTRSKLLSPAPVGLWRGAPLAVAACRNLLSATAEVKVVVRTGDDAPNRELRKRLLSEPVALVECGDADQGISASLRCGLRASAEADGWLIALADMPAIRPSTIRAVAEALARGAACAAPRCGGQRGHPVAFGRVCFDALLQLRGDEGARAVLKLFPPLLVDVDDAGCLLDIDKPYDTGERT